MPHVQVNNNMKKSLLLLLVVFLGCTTFYFWQQNQNLQDELDSSIENEVDAPKVIHDFQVIPEGWEWYDSTMHDIGFAMPKGTDVTESGSRISISRSGEQKDKPSIVIEVSKYKNTQALVNDFIIDRKSYSTILRQRLFAPQGGSGVYVESTYNVKELVHNIRIDSEYIFEGAEKTFKASNMSNTFSARDDFDSIMETLVIYDN